MSKKNLTEGLMVSIAKPVAEEPKIKVYAPAKGSTTRMTVDMDVAMYERLRNASFELRAKQADILRQGLEELLTRLGK